MKRELFFFGGTNRPVMIHLSHDFTLYGADFGDCTGLCINPDEHDRWSGLHIRTPRELFRLVSWLRGLEPPQLADGASDQISETWTGLSPEFADESIPADEEFEGYDATALTVSAVWSRRDHDDGLCLHLGAQEPDGLDVQGVPTHLVTALTDALEIFAREWDQCGIDLTADQPLAHIAAQ